MFPRTLACVALVLTCAASTLAAADETWPQKVTVLRSSGPQSFQLQAHIEAGSEKLIADISYSPPDRRCLILRDAFDGLPLLVATDGIVLLYDPIGGQILKIRADPEFLAEHTPEDAWRIAWGMRADFPDVASQATVRLDFGSIFRRYAKSGAGKLALNPTTRTAEIADKGMKVSLTVDEKDPPRPTAFSMDGPRLTVRCKSFVYDAPLPKWHREINTMALFKHLPLRAVRISRSSRPMCRRKWARCRVCSAARVYSSSVRS
jgi:hypothetical protein